MGWRSSFRSSPKAFLSSLSWRQGLSRLSCIWLFLVCSGSAGLCSSSNHLPDQELSPAWSSPFHDPTRISCREPRRKQRRSKTLPILLLEQSEEANPNFVVFHPKPTASEQLEHNNPPGQHVPSLKLNQQLMNISRRQRGQVDRADLLFMTIGEGKAVSRASRAQTFVGISQ